MYSLTYNGVSVKYAKLKKADNFIRGSVDGNRFGDPYDVALPGGFSDKNLISQGFTEELGGNGSIFYYYENDAYAHGIEISKGVNNQDYGMTAVSDYAECMAVGFPYAGGVVFDLQKNIQARTSEMYGAIAGAFGILKDGKMNTAGKGMHGDYYAKSERTILAEDPDYIYAISSSGVTGKSGLTGSQLYGLVKRISGTMINAICFDGGGSGWTRERGKYLNSSTRKVKNAWLIFAKPIEKEEIEGEGMFYIKIAKGTYSKNGKRAIPTRLTAQSKYDTNYPIYVGDVLGLTGDPISSAGKPIYKIGEGPQKGRYIIVEENDMVDGYLKPTLKP